MRELFTLIKIQHETVEFIETYTAITKAEKAFVREIYAMNPSWDSLDVDDYTDEYAYFFEGGSLQIIHHEVLR